MPAMMVQQSTESKKDPKKKTVAAVTIVIHNSPSFPLDSVNNIMKTNVFHFHIFP
jgi:hypothetical protein